MLGHDFLLLLFPVHAKGRVGDEVIEPVFALFRELVVGEGIAELDVLAVPVVVNLLHQHV
jgi:hypothetical protein